MKFLVASVFLLSLSSFSLQDYHPEPPRLIPPPTPQYPPPPPPPPQPVCRKVPKEMCHKVPKTIYEPKIEKECQPVPDRVCADVDEQVCEPILRPEEDSVAKSYDNFFLEIGLGIVCCMLRGLDLSLIFILLKPYFIHDSSYKCFT